MNNRKVKEYERAHSKNTLFHQLVTGIYSPSSVWGIQRLKHSRSERSFSLIPAVDQTKSKESLTSNSYEQTEGCITFFETGFLFIKVIHSRPNRLSESLLGTSIWCVLRNHLQPLRWPSGACELCTIRASYTPADSVKEPLTPSNSVRRRSVHPKR